MKSGFITDRGRRRPTNEDSLRACEDLDFFMLADGVGGNRSGEIASQSALDALEKFVRHNPPEWQGSREEVFRYFRAAVNYVNQFSCQRPNHSMRAWLRHLLLLISEKMRCMSPM